MQIPTVATLLRNDNVFTTLNYIIPKKYGIILISECKIFTDEETIYGADSRGEHF